MQFNRTKDHQTIWWRICKISPWQKRRIWGKDWGKGWSLRQEWKC